ncbi:MAG: hypothetical protein GWN62_05870, partial [Aliifodinibius sp.]|nr:hypothetical protein [Fodinibius sp.]
MKTILTGMLIIIIHSFGLFMFAKGQGELRKFNNEISDHRRLAESYKQYYQNRFQTSISSPSDSNVTVVGRWAWGACQDVEVIGDYAYIGNGGLFQVLNISTPSAPDIAGEVLMPERVVSELEISGNYAYVLNPFSVIDISDPTNPQVVFSQLV